MKVYVVEGCDWDCMQIVGIYINRLDAELACQRFQGAEEWDTKYVVVEHEVRGTAGASARLAR